MTETLAAERVHTRQRSRVAFVGSFVVAAALLALALRDVDLRALAHIIRGTNLGAIGIAVASLSLSYFARGIRWRMQIRAAASIGLRTAFWTTMASYLTNNLLPLRAGELVRPLLTSRVAAVRVSYALAAQFVEHLVDIAALVVMSFLATAAQVAMPPALRNGATLFTCLGLIGTALLIPLALMEDRLGALLDRLNLPRSLAERLQETLRTFAAGLRSLRAPRDALAYLAVTAAVWLFDVLMGLAVAWALGISLAWPHITLLLVALSLASAAPSTPANIGVWQIVAVALLVPLGVMHADAIAYILVFQVVTYGVESFWGLLGLACLPQARLRRSWREGRESP